VAAATIQVYVFARRNLSFDRFVPSFAPSLAVVDAQVEEAMQVVTQASPH
jgi:hypothetical protein